MTPLEVAVKIIGFVVIVALIWMAVVRRGKRK